MKVFDKNGKKIELQEIEDTGWEDLYNNYQIRGRIKNGIATICIYNLPYTPEELNVDTVIIALPEKYRPTRVIYFVATRYIGDPTFLNGYVNSDGNIALYFNQAGSGNYNATVTYPVN